MVKLTGIKKKLFNIKLRMLLGGSAKKNIGIAPTLSQYGINLRDFTNYFEANSFFVKEGFEVSCVFSVDSGKIINFKLFEPSSSFYIKNFFLYKNLDVLTKNELFKLIYEVSKIKSNKYSNRHVSLYSIGKSQLSILKSYSSGVLNEKIQRFFLC